MSLLNYFKPYSLFSIAFITYTVYIAIGCDFVSACAGCSLSMSNRPDTRDSLHVTNLALDVVLIAAIFHFRS